MNFADRIRTHRQRIDGVLRDLVYNEQRAADERAALALAMAYERDVAEARGIVQDVAESVQRMVHSQIAEVVSCCLRAVFGDDAPELKIDFVQKRGKTEARFAFVRGDMELTPKSSESGGMIDVVSFALRVAALLLTRPRPRRFIACDEPWKHLSVEYRAALRDMIVALAREKGIQFLIVTHAKEFLAMGTVVRLD